MLEPTEQNLEGRVGADYFDTWDFWENKANHQVFDFTGWTQFTLIIGGITLTEGNGLTIDRTGGTVSPSIDRSVTTTQRIGTSSYALSAIDEDGKLGFLMIGVFNWKFGNPT